MKAQLWGETKSNSVLCDSQLQLKSETVVELTCTILKGVSRPASSKTPSPRSSQPANTLQPSLSIQKGPVQPIFQLHFIPVPMVWYHGASRFLTVHFSQLIVPLPFNPQWLLPSTKAGTSFCFLRKQELGPGTRPELVVMIWPAPSFPGREEPAIKQS